jgi:hypothetical protein
LDDKNKNIQSDCIKVLYEIGELKTCATNQLPMYAENAAPVIPNFYKKEFMDTLSSHLCEIEKESTLKRVEKVILKMSKTL